MSKLTLALSSATAQAVAGAGAATLVGLLLVNGLSDRPGPAPAEDATGSEVSGGSSAAATPPIKGGKPSTVSNKTFTISGEAVMLVPGADRSLQLTLANKASQAIKVRSLTVRAADARDTAGRVVCEATNLLLGSSYSAASGSVSPTNLLIDGRSSASTVFPVRLSATADDGCQNVTWALTYSGTADQA